MARAPSKTNDGIPEYVVPKPKCGIVRPIADVETYPPGHWNDVHDILSEATEEAGFEARLVSENESVGVILGNIVSNLFSDEIVVCDVSSKNPNVMFELGMRVAFEKPVVIVTDDVTPFSFDISPIKHIIYPKSLRFRLMNIFKDDVAAAISATIAETADSSYKGYLQQFGPIEIAKLSTQIVSSEKIVEDLQHIRRSLSALEAKDNSKRVPRQRTIVGKSRVLSLASIPKTQYANVKFEVSALDSVESVGEIKTSGGGIMLRVTADTENGFTAEEAYLQARRIRTKYTAM